MKVLDHDGTDHLVDKIYDLINSGGSADYIVEQGTSGIWTYRKWASGIAECWGRLSSASTTATYVNLNGYMPSGIMDTTTPKYINASGGFSGVPDSHIGYCRCSVAGRYDIYIYRSATLDRVADIDVTIKGLWKEFTPSAVSSNYALSADFVVERGTATSSDNIAWTYRKWNSGLAECWGEKTLTLDITTGQGTIVLSQPTYIYLPTNFFTHVDSFSIRKNSWNSNSGIFNSAYESDRNAISLNVFRGNTASAQSVQLVLFVIGRWK